jgi:hypothetical protein
MTVFSQSITFVAITSYNMFVDCPLLDNDRFNRIFRLRVRMPYHLFQELVAMVVAQEDALFRTRWREGAVDAIGQPAAPLVLLILCVLHFLGRGWTLVDLSENTGISKEVMELHQDSRPDFVLAVTCKRKVSIFLYLCSRGPLVHYSAASFYDFDGRMGHASGWLCECVCASRLKGTSAFEMPDNVQS